MYRFFHVLTRPPCFWSHPSLTLEMNSRCSILISFAWIEWYSSVSSASGRLAPSLIPSLFRRNCCSVILWTI